MTELAILVVEDEPEVRDALVRDLAPFAARFRVEAAESAEDALALLEELDAERVELALVLADHLLPGASGVDLLVRLNGDERFAAARKVLVTGQAGLSDTIRAVNDADLDHYVAKPWAVDALHGTVRHQLTDYVLDEVDDLLPYVQTLDAGRLMDAVAGRASDR